MNSKFILASDLEVDHPYWGSMAWISRPGTTGAKHLVVGLVEFGVGGHHSFHTHPGQEEVIYLLSGEVEQWLNTEKRIMRPGDEVFVGAGVVHATYNVRNGPSRVLVVVAPCVGEGGYAAVEMADRVPWKTLRSEHDGSEASNELSGCGRFINAGEVEREQLDWGELGWLSRPSSTLARDLVMIEVKLKPGKGHNFHKHPDQEEVIYVVEGEVEQWLESEKRILKAGDSVFINKDVVHASFNRSSQPAKLMAILGPAVSAAGYVSVEVGDQSPWKSLR